MGTSIRQQRDKGNPELSIAGESDNHPMYFVSWEEVVEYCNVLSRREGLTPCYSGSASLFGSSYTCNFNANGYRLPTEAEWEYAARGGGSGRGTTYAGSNSIDRVAWYDGNSGKQTHPVGGKQSNELGLFDMSGNVWEWYWDSFGLYSSQGRRDPASTTSGGVCMYRGGSWVSNASYSRTAIRDFDVSASRGSYLGFRVVRRL